MFVQCLVCSSTLFESECVVGGTMKMQLGTGTIDQTPTFVFVTVPTGKKATSQYLLYSTSVKKMTVGDQTACSCLAS